MREYKILSLVLFWLIPAISFPQEKVVLNNANTLTGKTINGQQVREASGNVSFTQGNIKVFCNSATQYIDANKVELHGNVKIIQDTLSLFTSNAVYLGNERQAICDGGVTLKDPNATLRSNKGTYFFNDARAEFSGDVIIVNPGYRITSRELTYMRMTEDSFGRGNVTVTTDSAIIKAELIDFYKRQGRTFARKNVSINSDSTIITSDSLTNFSTEKKSVAAGNVKIVSLNKNAVIYGNYIENYERTNYTKLIGNARLIHYQPNKDTVFVYSHIMEAFRNDPEYYVSRDSVEMIRGEFLGKCGLGIYYRTSEKASLSIDPIIWQRNIQATADSIYADLPGNRVQTIYLKYYNARSFVLSRNNEPGFDDRFDQITSRDMILRFIANKINVINTYKESESIYFVFEDSLANGVNSVSGENMDIFFNKDENVSRIIVDKDVSGKYIPENMIASNNLILPGFNPRTDIPFRRITINSESEK
jgi:lipopolysaccharide export system protein LptA